MRKPIFMLLSWLALSAYSLQSQAADMAPGTLVDLANGEAIYKQGKGAATACVACHGATALGMDVTGSSRLANIGQVYLLKQLDDYANDKRTDAGMGAMMNGIAKALSAQDRHDVAAYLDSIAYATESSDLKAIAESGKKVGDPNKGKLIMTKGIKPGIPPCQDCHGFSGRAVNIPAIHQQKYTYLVNQMNRYRDGTRANDEVVLGVGIMRGIAKKLSPQNIADISAYLSTVTDFTP